MMLVEELETVGLIAVEGVRFVMRVWMARGGRGFYRRFGVEFIMSTREKPAGVTTVCKARVYRNTPARL